MKVAVVGAGWGGLAAAVAAAEAGHRVTLLEASRALGGRARALPCTLPDGSSTVLDNGQHIMIGAYSETLSLMRRVGVDPQQALLRLPLMLLFADGTGLRLPSWPAPLDALAGIATARGWSLRDKASLMWLATRWRLAGFRCAADVSVAALCAGLSPRAMREMIEPLCVSALNTPADQASGEVFLRVMQDAVFGASGSSNLLLPQVDLSALFPQAAAAWVIRHGGEVRLGTRARDLAFDGSRWCVDGQAYDRVLLACAASDTLGLLEACLLSAAAPVAQAVSQWCAVTRALQYEAICTVYAWGQGATLAHPMLALRCQAGAPGDGPAQFVFDRGQLGGPHGLLAFVVSASHGDRGDLQTRVLAQARAQLGLNLSPVQTVVEKRATFACTPALLRPGISIAPGLLACGDYVEGPYPATLEGAVRSGLAAIRSSDSAS